MMSLLGGCVGAMAGLMAPAVASSEFLTGPADELDSLAQRTQRWGQALSRQPEEPAPLFNFANLSPSQKRELGEQLIREADAAQADGQGGATLVEEKSVVLGGVRVKRR